MRKTDRSRKLLLTLLACAIFHQSFAQSGAKAMEHAAEIASAQFSDNDDILITASIDGVVKLWDAKTGKIIRGLGVAQPPSKIFYAELSPNGEFVAVINGRAGRVWSTKFGDQAFPLTGHRDTIKSVHFSSNSKWLVTASVDGSAKVWECQSGKRHHSLNHMLESLSKKGSSGVTEAKFCNKNKWLITGSNKLTEADTGKLVSNSSPMRFDSTLLVWDLHSGKVIRSSVGYPFNTNDDGTLVVSGSVNTKEKCFRVWDAAGEGASHSIENRDGRITSCVLSRDGKQLLTSSSEDGVCKLWNVPSFKVVHTFRIGDTNVGNEVHFSHDGKWIASFSADSSKVWEAASGKLLHAFATSKPLVFSRDSKKMLVIKNKSVVQYDLISGKPVVFPKDADPPKTLKMR